MDDIDILAVETKAVRGSDYSPAIALSEEKDKLVTGSLSHNTTN